MHGHHGSAVEADAHTDTRPWGPMIVALVAQVLVVIDISVVNTAMPTIGHELGLGSSDLQWVVTAYLLMSGGCLLLGGRIADLISRRTVFLTGLTLFTTASLFTGFAGGAAELIGGRAAQGAAAALMTPAALSIISTTYTGTQKARGLALWGAIGGLGIAVGVALGGVLTTWASWEAIFWINVPIGVLAIAATFHVVAKDQKGPAGLAEFDVPGALVGVGSLATLMFTLARVESQGWASVQTAVGLGVAAILMVAFVFIEGRATQPLVHPHTWKISSLVSSTTVMLGITGLLMAVVFLTVDLRADGPRLLRPGVGPRVPPARRDPRRRHPPRRPRQCAPPGADHRRHRAGHRLRRRTAPVPCRRELLLRRRDAAGAVPRRSGCGTRVRRRRRHRDERHSGRAHRHGVGVPDDRA